MNDERRIGPQHKQIQAALRVVGPLTLGVGLVLVAIGVAIFFDRSGVLNRPDMFDARLSGSR